jgi:galactan endo-1,6-beta-galactosidase
MTQTGSGEKYQSHSDTALSGKRFWSWFPANTIQTFEVQNVTP